MSNSPAQLKRNDDTSQLYRDGSYEDDDDRRTRLRSELLSKILLEPHIFKVLDMAGSWWLPWRNLWPPFTEVDERSSLADFVQSRLAQDNLTNVASGLICIAICLQQMRPGADDYNIPLSAPPNELANKLLTAVDQLALADDDNLASSNGLEALVLRAKSYVIASNQLRKSWLLIRRAISIAQLIDLPGIDLDGDPGEKACRQNFMGALFETDRFMSLLMGLPYAVDDNFSEKLTQERLMSPIDITSQMRALRRMAALVAGKVNDRNSSTSEGKESAIYSLQQTLDDAASTMPPEWWYVHIHSDPSNDTQSSHEHLLSQLWFYQVQSFLHLPLMLKPASDARYERSRLVCLSSSRNLLRVYHAMRQPHLAPYSSKCVDFQALIAAVLVLLGLLQKGSQHCHRKHAGYQEDVELINLTRQVFELSSMEQAGSIAKQGVHMIDSLGAFVTDGERNNFIRTATLFVPYFGTVSVQAGHDNSATSAPASERTNSIATYSDRSSSPHSSTSQQNPPPHSLALYPGHGHPRQTAMSANNSNTPYQLGIPGLGFDDMPSPTNQLMPLPLPLQDHRTNLTGTQRKHSLPLNLTSEQTSAASRKFSLPQSSLYAPHHAQSGASNAFNAFTPSEGQRQGLADVDVDETEAGYVYVDVDWQRLMVGAESDGRQDWNVDPAGGGREVRFAARVVGRGGGGEVEGTY